MPNIQLAGYDCSFSHVRDPKPVLPQSTQLLPFERELILDAEWQLLGASVCLRNDDNWARS